MSRKEKTFGTIGKAMISELNTKFVEQITYVDKVGRELYDSHNADTDKKLQLFETFILQARSVLRQNVEGMAEFADGIGNNPLYQFGWAEGYAEAAAELDIFVNLIHGCIAMQKAGKTYLEMYDILVNDSLEETLRRARSESRSTNRSSNIVEDKERVIWARVHNRLIGKW